MSENDKWASLRVKAQEILEDSHKGASKDAQWQDVPKLLEELSIYQVELEVQNEELRQAQQALQLEKESFKELFELAPIGYIIVNIAGKIIKVNKKGRELLGQANDTALKASIFNYLVTPADQKAFRHLILQAHSQSETRPVAIFLKADDHEGCWTDAFATSFLTAEGQLFRVALVDVSARKAAEIQLLQNEQKFRAYFENSPIAAMVIDANGRYKQINDAACQLTGYTREELLKMGAFDIVAPTHKSLAKASLHALLKEGNFKNEFNILRKNGELVNIILNARRLGDGSFIGFHENVSHLQQVQAALRLSENKFRKIFENSVMALCITNQQGYYEMVNPAYCQLYGYQVEELIGKPFTMVVPDEQKELFENLYQQSFNEEDEIRGEFQVKKKDGSLITVMGVGSLIDWGDAQYRKITSVVDITERKKAEEALKKSEERYRLLAENSTDIISLYRNYEITYVSPSVEWVLGFSPEEYKSFTPFYNVHPDDLPGLKERVLHRMEQKAQGNTTYEYRYLHKDGFYVWLEAVAHTHTDAQGDILTLINTRNISEKKQAEAKLKEREQYLSGLNQLSAFLLNDQDNDVYQGVVDIIGPMSNASRAYIFLNGKEESGERYCTQVAEWCAPGVTPEIDNPQLKHMPYKVLGDRWWDTLAGGQLIAGKVSTFPLSEQAVLNPQGILALLAIPLFIEECFHGFIGFDNCVSQRQWEESEINFLRTAAVNLQNTLKRQQDRKHLRFSEQKYRSVVNALVEGVVMQDESGKVITYNKAALDILGLSDAHMAGLLPLPADWGLLEENGTPLAFDQLPVSHTMTHGERLRDVVIGIKKTHGNITWINVNTEIVPGLSSEGKAVLSSFADITLIKETEQQLRELNATKDKFFSIIAHDLRGPLGQLTALSQLILSSVQAKNNEDSLQMTAMMHKASLRASELLDNLLEWSRTQTKRIPFSPTTFNICDLMEENQLLLKETAAQKGISFLFDCAKKFHVFADRQMINTILRNLIANAIKFTPRGGQVSVFAKVHEDKIKVVVQDNGIGIAPENIAKLFRLDVHFTTPGTENEAGTGLGLILCKEFVAYNGGEIWVESTYRKGTSFIFTLPQQAPQPD